MIKEDYRKQEKKKKQKRHKLVRFFTGYKQYFSKLRCKQ